jgi:Multiubiquitin
LVPDIAIIWKESAMAEVPIPEPAGGSSRTEYAIVINGELAIVPHQIVSYTEVVAIAYPVPPTPQTLFTVSFEHGKEPREGMLVAGQTVEVKTEGTTFDVVIAGKS